MSEPTRSPQGLKLAYFPFGLAIIPLGLVLLAAKVAATSCQISQSIYRDADGKGFELIFGRAIPGTASSDATATISHSQQTQVYYFDVGQSSGYGTISLADLSPQNGTLADNSPLNLFFFDQASQSVTPLFLEETTEAPEYAFVSGLGSYDYYARRGMITEDTPPLLGDMMWVYDRCQ
ncbi:MAG: hypothetical protein AAFY20_13450 [Cyanobacteria bacterium J06639_14]